MKKPALLLSLLALGALGLVACGGGDDDGVTAASKTKTTRDGPAADEKSCGRFGRYEFAVVEGDVSCRVARGVMRGNIGPSRTPGFWICYGSETDPACVNDPHGSNETVSDHSSEMILAWCCGTDQQEAYIAAADNLAMGVPDPAILEATHYHLKLLRPGPRG